MKDPSDSSAGSLEAMTEALPTGTVLIEQGRRDTDLLILMSGSLTVYRDGARIARIDEPGSYVGETSAFTGQPHSATVKVAKPARVVRVPGPMVLTFFRSSPDAAARLARNMAHRLHGTTDKLVNARAQRESVQRQLLRMIRDIDILYDVVLSAPDDQHARVEALNGLRRMALRHEELKRSLVRALEGGEDPDQSLA